MTEKEYIEKGTLLKHFDEVINNKLGDADFKKAAWGFSIYVDKMPAADVAPVKHGHWNIGYFHDRVCSCCLHPDNDLNDYAHDYCPNCGCKMDG